MKTHKYTEQELRFTAILYATRDDIIEYTRSNGKLPAKIPLGGFPTAMNILIKRRGIDAILSENEQLIFDALINEKRLPAGGVILIPGAFPIYSVEAGQKIEICPPPREMDWE